MFQFATTNMKFKNLFSYFLNNCIFILHFIWWNLVMCWYNSDFLSHILTFWELTKCFYNPNNLCKFNFITGLKLNDVTNVIGGASQLIMDCFVCWSSTCCITENLSVIFQHPIRIIPIQPIITMQAVSVPVVWVNCWQGNTWEWRQTPSAHTYCKHWLTKY